MAVIDLRELLTEYQSWQPEEIERIEPILREQGFNDSSSVVLLDPDDRFISDAFKEYAMRLKVCGFLKHVKNCYDSNGLPLPQSSSANVNHGTSVINSQPNDALLECTLCHLNFGYPVSSSFKEGLLLKTKHIRYVHNDCYQTQCPVCSILFSNKSFYQHFTRSCLPLYDMGEIASNAQSIIELSIADELDGCDSDSDCSSHQSHTENDDDCIVLDPTEWDNVQSHVPSDSLADSQFVAECLLYVQTRFRVSEIAINELAHVFERITKRCLSQAQARLLSVVPSMPCENSKAVLLHAIPEIFKNTVGEEAVSFSSQAARDRYLQRNCNFVPPQKVCLNPLATANLVYGYVVPFRQQLESWLQTVKPCDLVTERSSDGFMRTFQDGGYSVIMNLDICGIHILLYSDDVEVCNPLGSGRTKHKQTAIMFIPVGPEKRSTLKSIFIVAMAKTSYIKQHGYGELLRNLVEGLRDLNAGEIHGRNGLVRGSLIGLCGDELALRSLVCLKQNFTTVRKVCCTCHALRLEYHTAHFHKDYVERDRISHLVDCDFIQDESQEKIDRTERSKQSGINCRSVLFDIPSFEPKLMLHDNMHVLLEGIFPVMVNKLINLLLSNRVISFDKINELLVSFKFARICLKDKPYKLDKAKVLSGLKPTAKAAQMRVLTFHLPLILSDVLQNVPESNKSNVITMYKIMLQVAVMCYSHIASGDTATMLDNLVAQFNKLFVDEFGPSEFKPKMHFWIHFGEQVRNHGSLRGQGTIRFEGKFGYIKQKKWMSFKNITYSILMEHQRRLCMTQAIFPDADCDNVNNGTNFDEAQLCNAFNVVLPPAQYVLYTEGRLSSVKYVENDVVIVGCCDQSPIFGIIRGLVYSCEEKSLTLLCAKFDSSSWCDHEFCFHLRLSTSPDRYFTIKPSQLFVPWPQPSYVAGPVHKVSPTAGPAQPKTLPNTPASGFFKMKKRYKSMTPPFDTLPYIDHFPQFPDDIEELLNSGPFQLIELKKNVVLRKIAEFYGPRIPSFESHGSAACKKNVYIYAALADKLVKKYPCLAMPSSLEPRDWLDQHFSVAFRNQRRRSKLTPDIVNVDHNTMDSEKEKSDLNVAMENGALDSELDEESDSPETANSAVLDIVVTKSYNEVILILNTKHNCTTASIDSLKQHIRSIKPGLVKYIFARKGSITSLMEEMPFLANPFLFYQVGLIATAENMDGAEQSLVDAAQKFVVLMDNVCRMFDTEDNAENVELETGQNGRYMMDSRYLCAINALCQRLQCRNGDSHQCDFILTERSKTNVHCDGICGDSECVCLIRPVVLGWNCRSAVLFSEGQIMFDVSHILNESVLCSSIISTLLMYNIANVDYASKFSLLLEFMFNELFSLPHKNKILSELHNQIFD